jgi:hypothetical protein
MLSASPHNAARPSARRQPPPAGERSVSGPRFPIGMCGATTAYNDNANTMMRKVPPGRHVLVARDPSASAGDESSLGSLRAATGHLAWIRGVGLLRRAGPSDVQTVPRRHGLLVQLLRRLQRRKLRPRAGVLCRHHQRPRKCRRCSGRRRRRGSSCLRDWVAPGRGAQCPSSLATDKGRHQRTAGPST